MNQVAKIFINGRSQAVRSPAAYRFDSTVVFMRKDPRQFYIARIRLGYVLGVYDYSFNNLCSHLIFNITSDKFFSPLP